MEINKIIEEANTVADKYNLKLVEIDKTDNVISLKLVVDNELFIQIYGMLKRISLILPLSLSRDDYMDMTLKVVNTTAILLTVLTDIFLLITRNQYKYL